MPGLLFNREQWELVFELHNFGYSYATLATWLGVSESAIVSNFHRLGLKVPREELPDIKNNTSRFLALGGDDTDARP